MALDSFLPTRIGIIPVVAGAIALAGCSGGTKTPSKGGHDTGGDAKDKTLEESKPSVSDTKEQDEKSTLTATAPGSTYGPSKARPSQPEDAQRTEEKPKAEGDEPVLEEVGGLEPRRLVVSRGIEEREPVDAADTFGAKSERLYAFVELHNESDRKRTAVVTFEGPDGKRTGFVELSVPAEQPRWRTWAYSKYVTEPGTWAAVVRTPEGKLLGRTEFEITPEGTAR
jgi:hypothetical protein